MNLFIAPHNDDESLFGAFTLMREHPLVVIVTDSWKQYNRGTGITADLRWNETLKAIKILDCPVIRLGIRDDIIDDWFVEKQLSKFAGFGTIYVPAIQGGNPHHDIIGKIAIKLFGSKVAHYTTYAIGSLYTTGSREIVPTPEELLKKEQALMCYESQYSLPATKPHFEAVKGKSEWYM